jgi:hypothetical protein
MPITDVLKLDPVGRYPTLPPGGDGNQHVPIPLFAPKAFPVSGRTPLLIMSGSAHWGMGAAGQVRLGFDVTIKKISLIAPPPIKFRLCGLGWRDNNLDSAHLALTTIHRLIDQGPGEYQLEMTPIDGTFVSKDDVFSGHLIDF